jgi:hypothetical protein
MAETYKITSLQKRSREERRARGLVKPKRTKEQAEILMWEIYQQCISRGIPPAKIAPRYKISAKYAYYLVWKAKKIMQKAEGFDPDAPNLQKEMLKFMPAAAEALFHNLKKGEPRVTVAYLQGTGALIPRQEVTTLTDDERKAASERSLKAINPKLRRALGIEDGADATIEPDEPKKP